MRAPHEIKIGDGGSAVADPLPLLVMRDSTFLRPSGFLEYVCATVPRCGVSCRCAGELHASYMLRIVELGQCKIRSLWIERRRKLMTVHGSSAGDGKDGPVSPAVGIQMAGHVWSCKLGPQLNSRITPCYVGYSAECVSTLQTVDSQFRWPPEISEQRRGHEGATAR